ncbi:MAG TPA: molybdopterin-dependent oxidoreductase [Myxococcales bacterium]|nr:molybdopterin-dependent oxidoreductase [Myxococcales bacterium]
MSISRRGLLGVAVGATGVGLMRQHLARADQKPEKRRLPQYDETLVPVVCQQCPGGCGLVARVIDGEVVGISGNRQHPVNRGGVCAKAFGALQLLHSPDRLHGPMIRDGQRGRFKAASWDEAMRLVADRLADLRAKRLGHTVAILGGQYRGTRDALFRRFARAYGTPNYLRARCLAPEEPALSHRLMHGATVPFACDLAESQIVVSFGAGILESWLNPVYASRAFGRLRRSEERRRGRLIQIEPRRSATAIKADRWVALRPGTDGILALGLANVLVREGLYDTAFVEEHTTGFADWTDPDGKRHDGFRSMVLKDYGLLAVSAATGVPVNTILEVARDLGTTRPAVVIGERGCSYGPDDLRTRMAIHSLNALVGSIGARGGLIPQAPLPLLPLPEPAPDEVARASLSNPRIDGAGQGESLTAADVTQALPGRILGGTPYPLNAIFLFATNPLASHPAKEEFAQAIEKVPLSVSFSPFMDETAAKCDVVLPDSLFLERWQDDPVTHLAGVSCYSVGKPASAPRYDTRSTADVVLQFAASLGGPVASALPWKTFEQALRATARGLFDARRGYVVGAAADETLRQTMERQGYWIPEFAGFDAFFDALTKRGAWWDPTALSPGRHAVFATASGKFEFHAPALQRLLDSAVQREGKESAVVKLLRNGAGAGQPVLPAVAWPALAEGGTYPLRLLTYRLATRPMGGARNQPWLLEQPAAHVRATWESWVEIHPRTAAALGVKDGDRVRIESAKGAIQLRARFYSGTREDVVHVPLGGGGRGPNINDLIASEPDPFRGFGLLGQTRVRIRRA